MEQLPDYCRQCPLAKQARTDTELANVCLKVKTAIYSVHHSTGTNREMQENMRQHVIAALQPHRAELILHSCNHQCAGGDGIEVLPMKNGKIIFMYDINGHGTPATIKRAEVITACRTFVDDAHVQSASDVEKLAHAINNGLIETSEYNLPRIEGMLLGIDEVEHALYPAKFGAMNAYIQSEDYVIDPLVDAASPASETWFGIHEFSNLHTKPRPYHAGDTVLLCSDGIAPIRETQDALIAAWSAKQMQGVQGLMQDKHMEQQDDVTVLQLTLL
ncbi:SpoIIE family protein phosphatase [Candidatus Peribacteria bacterium]|nr:SpoIIE family protein phosphatase [Candidatus Peribacteria bacterium]